jgi:hypothetical protein
LMGGRGWRGRRAVAHAATRTGTTPAKPPNNPKRSAPSINIESTLTPTHPIKEALKKTPTQQTRGKRSPAPNAPSPPAPRSVGRRTRCCPRQHSGLGAPPSLARGRPRGWRGAGRRGAAAGAWRRGGGSGRLGCAGLGGFRGSVLRTRQTAGAPKAGAPKEPKPLPPPRRVCGKSHLRLGGGRV